MQQEEAGPAREERLDPAAITWRRLSDTLWAGRTASGAVGQIEHGRRYLASDGEDRIYGRYRTLAEAQRAVARGVATGRRGRRGPVVGPVLLAVLGVVALGLALLLLREALMYL